MSDDPTVVLHLDDLGYWTLHVCGDPVTVLVVDERVPHDRAYRLQDRVSRETLAEIVGDSDIGHRDDGRYPNLAEAIAARGNRPRLVE